MLEWAWITIIDYVNTLKLKNRGKKVPSKGYKPNSSITASSGKNLSNIPIPLLVAKKQTAFYSEFNHSWTARFWFSARYKSEKKMALKNTALEDKLHQRRGKDDDSECCLIKWLTAAQYLNLTS